MIDYDEKRAFNIAKRQAQTEVKKLEALSRFCRAVRVVEASLFRFPEGWLAEARTDWLRTVSQEGVPAGAVEEAEAVLRARKKAVDWKAFAALDVFPNRELTNVSTDDDEEEPPK